MRPGHILIYSVQAVMCLVRRGKRKRSVFSYRDGRFSLPSKVLFWAEARLPGHIKYIIFSIRIEKYTMSSFLTFYLYFTKML